MRSRLTKKMTALAARLEAVSAEVGVPKPEGQAVGFRAMRTWLAGARAISMRVRSHAAPYKAVLGITLSSLVVLIAIVLTFQSFEARQPSASLELNLAREAEPLASGYQAAAANAVSSFSQSNLVKPDVSNGKAARPSASGPGHLLETIPQPKRPRSETAQKETSKEANLAGLAEIPNDLILNRLSNKDDRTNRKPSFAAYSAAREDLPWDAVEPVAFAPLEGSRKEESVSGPSGASGAAAKGPVNVSGAQIGSWLKGKATKIKGAEHAKALYHFSLWLEPPEAMKRHVLGVSYDFSSPAVRPQLQASSDRRTGFKVNAAGLACAEEITVTLRFNDGRVETINVDGCKLFDKA